VCQPEKEKGPSILAKPDPYSDINQRDGKSNTLVRCLLFTSVKV
jgi:hypothetical protein